MITNEQVLANRGGTRQFGAFGDGDASQCAMAKHERSYLGSLGGVGPRLRSASHQCDIRGQIGWEPWRCHIANWIVLEGRHEKWLLGRKWPSTSPSSRKMLLDVANKLMSPDLGTSRVQAHAGPICSATEPERRYESLFAAAGMFGEHGEQQRALDCQAARF